MNDSNFNSEPSVFKELPKEQQKELRKEFSEMTKADRNIIIVSIIVAAVMVTCAIIGIFSDHLVFGGVIFPAWIVPVMVASNEDKFAKWLKTEKNIAMKRKKQKP